MQRTFVLCYETKYVLTYFAISQRISPECREIQKSLDTRFEILKKKTKYFTQNLSKVKKNCYSIRSSRYFSIKRRGSGRPCLQVCGPEPMVASLTKAVEALSPTSRKMLDYEVWSFAF